MQISVELQDMFSYSPVIVYVILLLFLATLIIYLLKKYKTREKTPKVKVAKPKDIPSIKNKYCKILMDIDRKYTENKLSDRLAYQELSKAIRYFVYEVTGIRVQNYTLDEISKLNIPNLYRLVEDCYVPEFAIENNCNIHESITKARKVIEEWN